MSKYIIEKDLSKDFVLKSLYKELKDVKYDEHNLIIINTNKLKWKIDEKNSEAKKKEIAAHLEKLYINKPNKFGCVVQNKVGNNCIVDDSIIMGYASTIRTIIKYQLRKSIDQKSMMMLKHVTIIDYKAIDPWFYTYTQFDINDEKIKNLDSTDNKFRYIIIIDYSKLKKNNDDNIHQQMIQQMIQQFILTKRSQYNILSFKNILNCGTGLILAEFLRNKNSDVISCKELGDDIGCYFDLKIKRSNFLNDTFDFLDE